MKPRLTAGYAVLAAISGLAVVLPAKAASLQKVDNWGASGVPSTVSMYIYVPDNLADSPPILVLSHYCGGSASAVFGQAQGGGIVSAADQYGFIMVVPQAVDNSGAGRCWDVGTTASLTHDGGGDTEAIAQMVRYTLDQYGANPDRVYATGDSSGGMMTEALMAVYPDIFKAGSSFAGVPAGCWAEGASADGTWSGPCAGGTVSHTPEEWGTIVDNMYPGYTGHRPRLQIFHGDADGTISYNNQTEAIKEWTNVLDLSTDPTTTDNGVQLGNHQATRERWENSCGYVVLDAFTSLGGDHGPSDALFPSQYVIPFLGLDQTGPVDPEIEQCGSETGGSGGSGGQDAGGSSGAPSGGASPSLGGTGNGGTASGGNPGSGGLQSSGGSGTGGRFSSGGTTSGGASMGGTSSGGAVSSGGSSITTGGSASPSGGMIGNGGTSGVAGAMGATAGAAGLNSGAGTSSTDDSSKDSGCGCRIAGERSSSHPLSAFGALGLLALGLLRRQYRKSADLT